MNLPPDKEQRELALDISQSHHVEAPAGSGKTTLLVARFIKLLTAVRHPNEILALTFTNKAAGEMKIRIAGLFQKVEQGVPPANDIETMMLEYARKALAHHRDRRFLLLSPDALQVMTFHGFCSMLAKRAPLEAGASPGSLVIEEGEQDLFIEESVREAIRKLLLLPEDTPERKAFENRLLRLNNRLPALIDELKDLITRRDIFLYLVRVAGSFRNVSALEKNLTQGLEELVTTFLEEASGKFRHTPLGKNWEAFHRFLKRKGAPNAETLPEVLPGTSWSDLFPWQVIAEALTTQDGKPRRRFGPATGGFYKGFSAALWADRIKELPGDVTNMLRRLKGLPEPGAPPTDINALADLIILVAWAIRVHERRCQQRHVLDFVGLEQAALKVLSNDHVSDLQLFLDHRIQHLLVDEFQDTSRSQWLLIQRLCAGWIPGDGRTVFLVGDPKQSIYAFRKAEVRLFLEAKEGIPLSGQGILPVNNIQLKANFRSTDSLVKYINTLFGDTVMASPDEAFDEVPFQPSAACEQKPLKEESPPVSLNLFFKDSAVAAPEEAEALWLARTVKEVVTKQTEPISIGILLFARNRLQYYLKALRENEISLRVKEGLKICQCPEVMCLYELTAALCRPHDDLAWACLARSPWTWADAGVLLQIAHMAPAPWPLKLKLAAEKHPEIRRLQSALKRGLQRLGRDSLARVVQEVWMALEGPEKVAACFGPEGVANCRRFFQILELIETGIPEETLVRLGNCLENLYAPEAPDAPITGVNLMTVHGAKGLQFDVVFLPFLDWCPLAAGKPPPYLLERSPGKSALPLIAMGQDRRLGKPEPAYGCLKHLADGRKLGELKRELYVGMTRAKKQLFLSGVAQKRRDRINGPENSALRWILNHTMKESAESIPTFLNPSGLPVSSKKSKKELSLPPPASFEPQQIPYRLESPSGLSSRAIEAEELPWADADRHCATIRGTVTHRLIESLWHQGKLPGADRITTALISEGLNPDRASVVASEIEAELLACLNEPFFKWLLDRSRPAAESEWAIEAVEKSNIIRTGILDFVRKDENYWWIIDFKTSRPEETEKEAQFLARETDLYRPQLMAYRDMLARVKGIDTGKIRTGLYFTRIQKWHEVVFVRKEGKFLDKA